MALKSLGIVDSEDGTLLLGDAARMQDWKGSEEELVAALAIDNVLANGLPGTTIAFQQGVGVVWSLEGAGTVGIYSDPAKAAFVLVRPWLSEENEESEVDALAELPSNYEGKFAEFRVTCGYMAFFWSVERGDCIEHAPNGTYALVLENLMTDASGLIIPVENGLYSCFHDELIFEDKEARRCHLVRQAG